ncbi:hypothetical protein ACWKSP_24410 [Micromonosporaceae bacterium Da 78-11]
MSNLEWTFMIACPALMLSIFVIGPTIYRLLFGVWPAWMSEASEHGHDGSGGGGGG